MQCDYKESYKRAFQRNRDLVLAELRQGKLEEKIERFSILHGFTPNEISRCLETCPPFRATFAKNPNKQNFYEKKAAKFIDNLQGVENFINLPNNKLAVVRGSVFDYQEISTKGGITKAKTIDFQWVYNGFLCYATHKYTAEAGGSQDSAYKDLQLFIEECNSCSLPRTFFFVIADGDYYDLLDSKVKVTRIKRLKQLSNKSNVYTCTINELEILLQQVCQ